VDARNVSGHVVFLLSPANTDGRRGQRLLEGKGTHDVAQNLHDPSGARLGDVFTFMSQLYFRGKWRYAERFANPPNDVNGIQVIVPGHGLLDVNTRVTIGDLRAIASVAIDAREPRYARPLVRDVNRLHDALTGDDRVVFLGSVATDRYLHILSEGLGERLYVPAEFSGLGSLSRGSLLLRSVETETELSYVRARTRQSNSM